LADFRTTARLTDKGRVVFEDVATLVSLLAADRVVLAAVNPYSKGLGDVFNAGTDGLVEVPGVEEEAPRRADEGRAIGTAVDEVSAEAEGLATACCWRLVALDDRVEPAVDPLTVVTVVAAVGARLEALFGRAAGLLGLLLAPSTAGLSAEAAPRDGRALTVELRASLSFSGVCNGPGKTRSPVVTGEDFNSLHYLDF